MLSTIKVLIFIISFDFVFSLKCYECPGHKCKSENVLHQEIVSDCKGVCVLSTQHHLRYCSSEKLTFLEIKVCIQNLFRHFECNTFWILLGSSSLHLRYRLVQFKYIHQDFNFDCVHFNIVYGNKVNLRLAVLCHFWKLMHGVWKSQKKSHSTLRAKRATFTFWVDKS